ncbi:MAG: LptF/LptG family permease [Bacteroidetes bacterium]|nr:LptF/LptG family permease [Bacteroidota bacterium]
MKKLDIYIIKKFLGTFFFAIALLILIVIVFDISEKIDDFIEKDAPLHAILFQYYMNFIPYFVNLFSYLFTFISVVFFTAKMASNSEIVAILNSGISFRRFLVPYMVSAIILGLMSFYLANFLIPRTNSRMMDFEKAYLKNPYRNRDVNIHMQISPGNIVYMETYNNLTNTGYKFSMEKYSGNRLVSKLNAQRIIWDSISETWEIKNYVIRHIGQNTESITKGEELDTVINMRPEEFSFILEDMKTMNFMELRAFIDKERLKGSQNIKEFEVEKHRRIANPFATIILTLIGVSISSRKVRGGIGMHLGIGLTITFSFILFQQISTVFATRGNLDPWLSVWIPNFLFAIIAAFLIRIAPK